MLPMPAALFHRQRVLLSLLDLLGGKCTKLSLLKQMFLLCHEEAKQNIYDFHPYMRGPFSLVLYADLRGLERRGYLKQSDTSVSITSVAPQKGKTIESPLLEALSVIVEKYGKRRDADLLQEVYRRYPYFATRNPKYAGQFRKADPRYNTLLQQPLICTIGYEGKTIDAFLNQLMKNNIHVLVDIRNNPVSMKYGFSGKKLQEYCAARGIEYLGIPALGIPSAFRQNLDSSEGYKRLFVRYRREILPHATEYLQRLHHSLEKKKRLALMCFEKDHICCHRNDASIALSTYCNNHYELSHI